MVVIHGRSYRGFVGGHAGQCGSTRFFTVMFLPVIPLKGMWLVNSVTRAGHDMKLSGKSVVAAYMRSWGPLVAALAAFAGTTGAVISSAALGLTAWTWSWRFMFDGGRRKRLAMNQLALGTGCEPGMMTAVYADEVRASVDDIWRTRGNLGGSPGDIARFGTDDEQYASAAYGVLRMSALHLPPGERADVESDATRILDNVRELPNGDAAHPYRKSHKPAGVKALPAPRAAAEPSAPVLEDSPLIPLATSRLTSLLRDQLFGLAFAPVGFDATIFDIGVEQMFVRRTFMSRHVVLHLRAPRGAAAIHAKAFATRRRDDDLAALSSELLPSLAARLGTSSWGPLSVHLVWSGVGIIERSRDVDRALVAGDTKLNLHSIAIVDLAAKQTSVVRTKTRRITARIVDTIAECVDQAIR